MSSLSKTWFDKKARDTHHCMPSLVIFLILFPLCLDISYILSSDRQMGRLLQKQDTREVTTTYEIQHRIQKVCTSSNEHWKTWGWMEWGWMTNGRTIDFRGIYRSLLEEYISQLVVAQKPNYQSHFHTTSNCFKIIWDHNVTNNFKLGRDDCKLQPIGKGICFLIRPKLVRYQVS